MTTSVAVLLFVGLGAAAGDYGEDKALIKQAAERQRPAVAAPYKAASDALSRAESQAAADLALAQARLDLVQGRRALREGRMSAAAQKARTALAALQRLATTIDVSVYELQAEGIIARAERGNRAVATLGEPPQDEAGAEREMSDTAPPDQLARKARAAAKIARRYAGADIDDIDTRGDADALAARALERQVPHETYGYRPAEEIVDLRSLLERDEQRYFYERMLREAYKNNEAEILIGSDEARIAPSGDVAYPDNWPEIVEKRKAYAGGIIARSPSWVDKDGREWYMAVYDIQDVTYQPPDFHATDGLTITEQLRNVQDRAALRLYSEIFSGYPEDLAAGIPLLRYFGGIDDFEARGPKYSPERRRQVIDMIKRFTGAREATASIEP